MNSSPGAAPTIAELNVAPYGPVLNGYISSWDPTGCQVSIKGGQQSSVVSPFEASFSVLLRPVPGSATGEGTLTFSGGQRESGAVIPACAETFQLRGSFSK